MTGRRTSAKLHLTDQEAYVAVADELNDGTSLLGQPPLALEDLDTAYVTAAERYANEHGINWPPQVGDFDRWYERNLEVR